MRAAPAALWCIVSLLMLGTLATPLAAQHVLVAEYKKKPHIVRRVVRNRPFVEINGKLVAASEHRFALHQVGEYLPVFIAIRNVHVKTSSVQLSDSGSLINNEFHFTANFASALPLENVFVALELTFESGDKNIFLYEVGNLDRDQPRGLELVAHSNVPLGRGHYQLHLFSNGVEALHSLQPFDYREAMLDRMIAKRVQDRPDGPPAPFIGPSPEYPPSLQKTNTKGHTVIRLRVRANGAVLDPEVVEASDPAFGEAAVESLRQWRFFPRIKGGHAVDATVAMPIDFIPPYPAGKP
jgi:TonB family protein